VRDANPKASRVSEGASGADVQAFFVQTAPTWDLGEANFAGSRSIGTRFVRETLLQKGGIHEAEQKESRETWNNNKQRGTPCLGSSPTQQEKVGQYEGAC
jgi:hypothetical protein